MLGGKMKIRFKNIRTNADLRKAMYKYPTKKIVQNTIDFDIIVNPNQEPILNEKQPMKHKHIFDKHNRCLRCNAKKERCINA